MLQKETFTQALDMAVEKYPNHCAIKYTTLDYTRTYSEFRDDVDSFARALVSLGVKKGTKVSIWATNVPEWFITFCATVKIGAVLVSINTASKIYEAEYLLQQSDTHTLVMTESSLNSNYKNIMQELCPEIRKRKPREELHCKRLPSLRNVITIGYKMDGCLTFEEAKKKGEAVSLTEVYSMAKAVTSEDVLVLQYTSGTTGFPKGVMLSHSAFINEGKYIGDGLKINNDDKIMIQVPMFHCFGMALLFTAIMCGATIFPLPYFSARASFECVNKEKITCLSGVPTMFISMLNHPKYRETDFSSMRTGIVAGASCQPELIKRIMKPDEMNLRDVVIAYGQTETASACTMCSLDDFETKRFETVGKPISHVECKIIDPNTGDEVPAGVNGEFCSRGFNTMKGYYKMPDATKQVIDENGWLHSGDLAMRDEEGYYRITGRIKDMIIRGGENIYPLEIEGHIFTHPLVQDVQVIGVPDEKYGEEAMAFIILKEGKTIAKEKMTEYIKMHLARHKVPKYIEYVESFPKNSSGKVLKYKLQEKAKEILAKEEF